jgi:triosephosphate isomerase
MGMASHVIIGHSERRQFFAESDEGVNKKAKALLAAEITPIICVGESLEQNQAGETQVFVSGQVKAALAGMSAADVVKCVIAYEPIWAIGTGLAATAEQAQAICGGVVRAAVADVYGSDVAEEDAERVVPDRTLGESKSGGDFFQRRAGRNRRLCRDNRNTKKSNQKMANHGQAFGY